MAAGYLGKISAIVSASTGDFSSKLNGSAKDVRKFASTVEATIGSASRSAAASLTNMYSPLQKLERAIKAASTMELSFSGFAGAIKDVDTLQSRLRSLNQRQIDIILKTSGMRDISMFRDSLAGLRSQDYNLLVKVGGTDKLKQLRDQINAGGGEFGIFAQTKEAASRVAELKQRIDEAKKAGVEIVVGVDDSEVRAATKALDKFVLDSAKAMSVSTKGGRRAVAGRLRGSLIEGNARDEWELLKKQALASEPDSPKLDDDIAARRAEIDKRSAMLKELDARQAAVKTATGGRPVGVVDTTGMQADLEAAQKQYREFVAEARKKVSAAVGFEVDDSTVEKLVSGTSTVFDKTIAQGELIESVFKKAGLDGAAAISRLAEVMKELGISDFRATTTQLRQLVSASEQVNKPIGDMQKRLSAASYETQAAFLPTLNRAKAMAESLNDTIKRGVSPTKEVEAQFAAVESQVRRTKLALDALLAAEAKLGEVSTGEEVQFRAPAAYAAIARSAKINASAMALPAEALIANPSLAKDAAKIFSLTQRVTRELGSVLRRQVLGLDTTKSEADLARTLKKLSDLQDASEKRIEITVETAEAEAALKRLRDQEERNSTREIASRELAAGLPTVVRGKNGESREVQSTFIPIGTLQARAVDAEEKRRRQLEDDMLSPTLVTSPAGELREFTSSFVPAGDLAAQARTLAPRQADPRISTINEAWDMAVRGVPTKPEQIDQQFNSLLARVQGFDVGDRLTLDPLIAGFRDSVQAGEPLIAQFQRLLALEQAVSGVEFGRSLGGDIMSSERQVGNLKSGLVAVKGQIEQLPAPVRARFLPALLEAENEIKRLNEAGGGTADDFERAAASLRRVASGARDAAGTVSFRDKFGRDNEGVVRQLNMIDLRGYDAQMVILQQTLARVNAEARGPGVAAFNALGEAIESAMLDGTLGAPAVKKNIENLTTQAAAAIGGATGSGTSAKGLRRKVKRAGDVSRGGADNFSLALNQAAFAVDDFLSSTGGWEFKLRAISNNVTQLAFILGGTTGLFVGLGAVIGGQALVMLNKWINNGRTAEDQTKALNDALARQKSLAEELAQAFESLGESLSRGMFSDAADKGRQFAKSIEDIQKKQREQQVESVAGLDPTVVKERAQQTAIKRKLESQTDVGQILNLQRQLRESEERERAATRAAVSRPGPGMADVEESLRESVRRMAAATIKDAPSDAFARLQLRKFVEEDAARQQANIKTPANIADARAAIKARQKELGDSADGGFLSSNQTKAAREEIRRLEGILAAMEGPARRAADSLAIEVARSAEEAAASIRDAQEDVAEAIRRGVPAAGEFQAELNGLAFEMDAAMQSMRDAQAADLTADKKEQMVASAQARVEEVQRQQQDIEERAMATRSARAFGGERSRNALSAVRGRQFLENEQVGVGYRLNKSLDRETVARRQFDRAMFNESQARLSVDAAQRAFDRATLAGNATPEQQQAVVDARAKLDEAVAARKAADEAMQLASQLSDMSASLAEFAMSLESALARTRQVGEDAVKRSEAGADAAQRRIIDGGGGVTERSAAERQLLDDRERVAKAQNALSRDRSEAIGSPQLEKLLAEREAIRSQLEDAAVVGGGDFAEQERLRNRLAELDREEAVEIQKLTEARRQELEAITRGVAARERELDRARARDAENPTLTNDRRNIEAAMGDAERRAKEAKDRLLANPTLDNATTSSEADRELARARRRRQELEDNLDSAQRRFDADESTKKRQADIDSRERERAGIIGLAAEDRRKLTPAEKARVAELEELNRADRAALEADRSRATSPQRREIENEQRRQMLLTQAARGRDAGLTEIERFRKETEEGIGADIRARAAQIKGTGGDEQAFIGKAIANQISSVAPMLEEFRMDRENARLQGPSRAALAVSDVTTTQGMSELNRLLRGDDPAKDVNLAELRKQTDRLDTLIGVIRDNPLPVIGP